MHASTFKSNCPAIGYLVQRCCFSHNYLHTQFTSAYKVESLWIKHSPRLYTDPRRSKRLCLLHGPALEPVTLFRFRTRSLSASNRTRNFSTFGRTSNFFFSRRTRNFSTSGRTRNFSTAGRTRNFFASNRTCNFSTFGRTRNFSFSHRTRNLSSSRQLCF